MVSCELEALRAFCRTRCVAVHMVAGVGLEIKKKLLLFYLDISMRSVADRAKSRAYFSVRGMGCNGETARVHEPLVVQVLRGIS